MLQQRQTSPSKVSIASSAIPSKQSDSLVVQGPQNKLRKNQRWKTDQLESKSKFDSFKQQHGVRVTKLDFNVTSKKSDALIVYVPRKLRQQQNQRWKMDQAAESTAKSDLSKDETKSKSMKSTIASRDHRRKKRCKRKKKKIDSTLPSESSTQSESGVVCVPPKLREKTDCNKLEHPESTAKAGLSDKDPDKTSELEQPDSTVKSTSPRATDSSKDESVKNAKLTEQPKSTHKTDSNAMPGSHKSRRKKRDKQLKQQQSDETTKSDLSKNPMNQGDRQLDQHQSDSKTKSDSSKNEKKQTGKQQKQQQSVSTLEPSLSSKSKRRPGKRELDRRKNRGHKSSKLEQADSKETSNSNHSQQKLCVKSSKQERADSNAAPDWNKQCQQKQRSDTSTQEQPKMVKIGLSSNVWDNPLALLVPSDLINNDGTPKKMQEESDGRELKSAPVSLPKLMGGPFPSDTSYHGVTPSPTKGHANLLDWHIAPHHVMAMDCEMVGVGEDGTRSMLARVSLVDWNGAVLVDTFVKPTEPVTNYRTFVSGVRPHNLAGQAIDFQACRALVQNWLQHKPILVGHGLSNDLAALQMTHPWCYTRDSTTYLPFTKKPCSSPKRLKVLVEEELGVSIQLEGHEHCSVQDARAVMELYKLKQKEWDNYIRWKCTYALRCPLRLLSSLGHEQSNK